MNRGPLVSEVTALPTEPQPLPKRYFDELNQKERSFIYRVNIIEVVKLVKVSPMQ